MTESAVVERPKNSTPHVPSGFIEDWAIRPKEGRALFLHAFFCGKERNNEDVVGCSIVHAISHIHEDGDSRKPIIGLFYLSQCWLWDDPYGPRFWCYTALLPGDRICLVENNPSEVQRPNGVIIQRWERK